MVGDHHAGGVGRSRTRSREVEQVGESAVAGVGHAARVLSTSHLRPAAQWRFDPRRGDYVRINTHYSDSPITQAQARTIGQAEFCFEQVLQDATRDAMLLPFAERGPYRDRVYAQQMAIRKQAIQQALQGE